MLELVDSLTGTLLQEPYMHSGGHHILAISNEVMSASLQGKTDRKIIGSICSDGICQSPQLTSVSTMNPVSLHYRQSSRLAKLSLGMCRQKQCSKSEQLCRNRCWEKLRCGQIRIQLRRYRIVATSPSIGVAATAGHVQCSRAGTG